ncbi:MAG: cytochrome P450 [Myxococcota bacterium]
MVAPVPDVPQVRGLPGIGVLIPFARDPLGFVSEVARDHGDLAQYRIVDHTLLQLSHPDLVEQVLVEHAKSMHKDAIYALIRPILGNGLVTSEGETWRRHRKLAAPSFTKRHVERYAEAFVAAAEAYAATLVDGGSCDLHADWMALTKRIVLDTLFGTDLGVDTTRVGAAIDTVMHGFVFEAQGLGRVLPSFVPTPGRRRAASAIRELDRVVFELIEARRRKGPGDDLLSRLLEARDDDGALTDVELRDEAVTAFVAGHETTALALTNAVILLSENPAARDALEAEVHAVLADRPATAADLPALRYTAAVIHEAMRILPPVWAIGREAQEAFTLSGPAASVRVEPGTQLLIPVWVLHHDPRWFPDPLAFRPERWLDDGHDRPRMAFLPFGGGPRVCIGNHFALLEAVLVLATVTRRAQLHTPGPRPALVPSITLRPAGPVPATIVRRG